MNWREDIYTEIVKKLRAGMPGLGWIDVNRGQLKHGRESYPMVLPAVLIGFDNVGFTGYERGFRQGLGRLRVHYVTDGIAEYHEDSETYDQAMTEFATVDALTRIIAFTSGAAELSETLDKVSERMIALPDYSVWELDFDLNVVENHQTSEITNYELGIRN